MIFEIEDAWVLSNSRYSSLEAQHHWPSIYLEPVVLYIDVDEIGMR